MKTQYLKGNYAIEKAAALLADGECVALPTETVYGLAADATNLNAVNKIFEAKGRPKNHPLIVHIPNTTHLEKWASDIPDAAQKLATAFWPGPLTLLLKKASDVNTTVTGGLNTIGLRVPSQPQFLAVLNALGTGLAAPSANRYKALSPTIAEQVIEGLSGRIAGVLEGGHCEHGLESTIVDLVGEMPRVLRAGPITAKQIEAVLGVPVATPKQHIEVVPGNVKAHYQPVTPLCLASTDELHKTHDCLIDSGCHIISHSLELNEVLQSIGERSHTILPKTAAEFGQALYVTLYQIDKLKPTKIVVERPPQDENWAAVNDRLSRAASEGS